MYGVSQASNELIKITVATVITGVLHIVGITIFWERMPASYYLIGIMLQFFLTVGVRFSYRFVLLERNRREKSEREERSKNVMIIGAGEAAGPLSGSFRMQRKPIPEYAA